MHDEYLMKQASTHCISRMVSKQCTYLFCLWLGLLLLGNLLLG